MSDFVYSNISLMHFFIFFFIFFFFLFLLLFFFVFCFLFFFLLLLFSLYTLNDSVQSILSSPKIHSAFAIPNARLSAADTVLQLVKIYEPRHDKTCLREFPTRPDTNRPAHCTATEAS